MIFIGIHQRRNGKSFTAIPVPIYAPPKIFEFVRWYATYPGQYRLRRVTSVPDSSH